MKKFRTFIVLTVSVLAMVIGLAALGAGAADHLDAPAVTTDGRFDINDVYAFPKGPDTVLALTVNPAAGVLSPTTFASSPGDSYEFAIDTDGDAVEDKILRITATRPRRDDGQRLRLFMVDAATGRKSLLGTGDSNTNIPLSNGGWLFGGLTDDPFFFDLQAFRDQVGGAGGTRMFCDANTVDFFAGFNATTIVIQMPSWELDSDDGIFNVWARTNTNHGMVDRMAKPALNTVFIASGDKDAYNATVPADDLATWGDRFKAVLQLFGGYDDATAEAITGLLLPDVLTLNTASTGGFVGSLNGRQLAEDVIDFELTVVTNGGITSDCVDMNDNAFKATFPYLADPN